MSVWLGGQNDYDDTTGLEWSQTGNQSGSFVYKKIRPVLRTEVKVSWSCPGKVQHPFWMSSLSKPTQCFQDAKDTAPEGENVKGKTSGSCISLVSGFWIDGFFVVCEGFPHL